jgi:diguanylate cyclase (GGDEF)-like protein
MEIRLYLQMLRRSWWIVALTALVAVTMALVATYITQPLYQSNARFVVSPNSDLVSGKDVVNSLEALDKRSIISTYAEGLNSRRIHDETISALQLSEATFEDYSITTVVLPEANIIDLIITGPDPVMSADLANFIGQRTIDFMSQLYTAYTISVLDPAVPSEQPFSPQPLRNLALALALGLVGGATLAILSEQIRIPIESFRRRIRIDNDTGVFSNRYFRRLIGEELTRNPDKDLSLGIVALDGLHEELEAIPQAASQKLLREVTNVLRNELRGNDMVGRWGETSFSVMLPATANEAASRTFERIFQALSKPVEVDQFEIAVSLNPKVGAAGASGSTSAEALVEGATKALEQAMRDVSHPVQYRQVMGEEKLKE